MRNFGMPHAIMYESYYSELDTLLENKAPTPTDKFVPSNIKNMFDGNILQESPTYISDMKKMFPHWYICAIAHGTGLVFQFLRSLNIKYNVHPNSKHIFTLSEDHRTSDKENTLSMEHGMIEFVFEEANFVLATYTIDLVDMNIRTYLACPDFNKLHRFLKLLQMFSSAAQSKFLIFDGEWSYDTKMHDGLSEYTWDSLIMNTETKNTIREDVNKFFNGGNEIYQQLGIPYKRGALFIGPPGCGKSLTAKIIANEFNCPFIYVLGLRSARRFEEHSIKSVFEKARELSPCIILFEDIDALVAISSITNPVKTYLLNSIDGFFSNDGVLVIATTNRPQDVDLALLNRPSRFDRKYEFKMPTPKYRKIYLEKKISKVISDVSSIEKTLDTVAKETKGHSYAMLQELVLTASYDYIYNSKDISQALMDAVSITNKQVMLGKADNIVKRMQDNEVDEPVGLRSGRSRRFGDEDDEM